MDHLELLCIQAALADNDGMPDTAKNLRGAAREIARLQAIVAQYPKTADNVPVVPGMRLYTSSVCAGWIVRMDVVPLQPGTYGVMPIKDLYNTREAAEAAEAAKGK